jgi:hypothetical protein
MDAPPAAPVLDVERQLPFTTAASDAYKTMSAGSARDSEGTLNTARATSRNAEEGTREGADGRRVNGIDKRSMMNPDGN